MTNEDVITEALTIIKGAKVYNVNFKNGTFECGSSVFSFEVTKPGLIKPNSIKFLSSIEEFKKGNNGSKQKVTKEEDELI